MTTRRTLSLVAAAVLGAVAWYLFRPELLFVDRRAAEAAPATADSMSFVPVASGTFLGDAHETSGTVTVLRAPSGAAVLRLTGFATSNGPDVRVYLVATDTIHDAEAVTRAGFVDLGALKGNLGDQNYELPAGVDLARYRAVSIWCRRFAVNFGAAALH
jgi:hypothetical protein